MTISIKRHDVTAVQSARVRCVNAESHARRISPNASKKSALNFAKNLAIFVRKPLLWLLKYVAMNLWVMFKLNSDLGDLKMIVLQLKVTSVLADPQRQYSLFFRPERCCSSWIRSKRADNEQKILYREVRKRLRDAVRRKQSDFWKNGDWMFYHALIHSSQLIQRFLMKHGIVQLYQPLTILTWLPETSGCFSN